MAVQEPYVVEEAVCPSCGSWAPLLELTGWCLQCSRALNPNLMLCESCGSTFNGRGQVRHKCQTCVSINWESRNADKIEFYLYLGYSSDLARKKVEHENRPICLSCGRRIKKGTRGRHFFCRSTPQCRTAARRYKWYREHYSMDKEDAITKVLQSLTEPKGKYENTARNT